MKIRTVLIMLCLALTTVIEWNIMGTNNSFVVMLAYITFFIVLNFKKLNRII